MGAHPQVGSRDFTHGKKLLIFTPQKSNELVPKIAMFKGIYLFQPISLGIQPLVFGGVNFGDKIFILYTWKPAVAVNFHQLETPKTSNPVA